MMPKHLADALVLGSKVRQLFVATADAKGIPPSGHLAERVSLVVWDERRDAPGSN